MSFANILESARRHQIIMQRRTLVGFDVIVVHRLLKNSVHIPEDVLFSEELLGTGNDAALPAPVHEITQGLEGIGSVRAYFVDVENLAGSLAPMSDSSWLGRLGRTVALVGRGLPYMLGLRRRHRTASAH